MAKINIGKLKDVLPRLGYSPAQKTASGAGPHDKPKKYRNRDARRKAKRDIKGGDYE